MKRLDSRRLIIIYICLAASCAIMGVGITSLLLLVAAWMEIDISNNLWLMGIPPLLTLFLNVLFIELYLKLRRG
jgi:hypothetical protein